MTYIFKIDITCTVYTLFGIPVDKHITGNIEPSLTVSTLDLLGSI